MISNLNGKKYMLRVQTSTPTFISFQALQQLPDAQGEEIVLLLIQRLFNEFKGIFVKPTSLPPYRTHTYSILLMPNSKPPNIHPYRYPYYQKSKIKNQVVALLACGFIHPNSNPYASPVFLIKKKHNSWGFCVDYCQLNQITIVNKYPILNIDELLDELHGATVFSKIDLRFRYHQIQVQPLNIHKTAIRTHSNHYEFMVMPFGLTNAPSTLQSTMNDLFRPHLHKFILVFFDDILIYSRDMEQHLNHLQITLQLLQAHSYFAKMKKC